MRMRACNVCGTLVSAEPDEEIGHLSECGHCRGVLECYEVVPLDDAEAELFSWTDVELTIGDVELHGAEAGPLAWPAPELGGEG